jgi:amino acid transporter
MAPQGHKFGTFGGVFTPSMLTIFGVIMFMLSGFVVGQAGVWAAVGMVALASGITFLTALSISAISTNTAVRGGGAYFLISRSLGPEFGGAIGLALYAAQALSVPFYVLGFVEALTRAFPAAADYYYLISLLTASVILILAYFGAEWAIRVQYGIFAVLVVAIISFMSGGIADWDPAVFAANSEPAFTEGHDYWIVFAIFFPAVTGIMAGVNMSGDLKDPGKSLPVGTLAAVGVGFVVYVVQMIVIGGSQSRTDMLERPFETLLSQAAFGLELPVILGVFAATVSSAIGSIVGAPRILQALARDEAFPILGVFSKGSAKGDEPHRALVLTALMTFGILLVAGDGQSGEGGGPLVVMAAIITMFFLYTYGMCNLAAFVESFSQNPSFRPRFRYFHWVTGLLGTLGCIGAAMLIDTIAAFVAVAIIIAIYFYVRTRVLDMAFGDARRGFIYSRVRNYLLTLRQMRSHPKNWRPTILAFFGNPATRLPLIEYAQWLEAGRGIVTLATVVEGDFEQDADARTAAMEELRKFVVENDVAAFPEVVVSPNLEHGIELVLQAHSIGPIKPNVVLMGWSATRERAASFSRRLRAARALGMSLLTLYSRPVVEGNERIDIWWRGQENGHLMAILAHLMVNNHTWRGTRVRVLRHIGDEALRDAAETELHRLCDAARVDFEIVVFDDDRPSLEVIHQESGDARLVMLGFTPPSAEDSDGWHASMSKMLDGLPTTMLVSSTGEADLFA